MWSWADSELLFKMLNCADGWNVRTEHPISKGKRYGSLADMGSRGRGDHGERPSHQRATGGNQSGGKGQPHFVTLLAQITGQGRKGSASCKCSHLISQLTKYYGPAHKNQSAKLPGMLNSRSCDQKQAGSGDSSGEVAVAGHGAPSRPHGSQAVTETKQGTSPLP